MSQHFDHDAVRHRLADYITGDLDREDCRRIEEHLSACPECGKLLDTQREFVDALKDYACSELERHVDEETLIALADPSAAVEPDVRIAAENHMIVCERCADELEILIGLRTALKGNTPTTAKAQSWRHSNLLGILWRPTIAYAVAAAAVLVLLVQELSREQRNARMEDSGLGSRSAETVFILHEQTRTLGHGTRVRRMDGMTTLRVALSFNPDTAFDYAVRIRDKEGRLLLSEDLSREVADQASVLVSIPFDRLANDGYIAELLSINRASPEDSSVTLYPFRIEADTAPGQE